MSRYSYLKILRLYFEFASKQNNFKLYKSKQFSKGICRRRRRNILIPSPLPLAKIWERKPATIWILRRGTKITLATFGGCNFYFLSALGAWLWHKLWRRISFRLLFLCSEKWIPSGFYYANRHKTQKKIILSTRLYLNK